MSALLLAAVVSFTAPTTLADPIERNGLVVAYACDGARPLATSDTLTARLTVRRQSPVWITLASLLAAGNDASDAEVWAWCWPLVREDAERRWIVEKIVVAGARETLAVPVEGDGRFAEVAVRRRAAWSCTKGRAVP